MGFSVRFRSARSGSVLFGSGLLHACPPGGEGGGEGHHLSDPGGFAIAGIHSFIHSFTHPSIHPLRRGTRQRVSYELCALETPPPLGSGGGGGVGTGYIYGILLPSFLTTVPTVLAE